MRSASILCYVNIELYRKGLESEALNQLDASCWQPGTVMPDGTTYAGISPVNARPFFAAAADAPRLMRWDEAMEYAKDLELHGYRDWLVPSFEELDVIYGNKSMLALRGSFNERGTDPAGWYWSSSEFNSSFARIQRFSVGTQSLSQRSERRSARLNGQ